MDERRIVRSRLHGLGLWGPSSSSVEAVVGRLTAMQAQEFVPALWSVAQRAGRTTRAQAREAYDAGAILRTHVLRPTWHFVLPQDIRWLLRATAHRVQARNAAWYRQQGLDPALLARTTDVVASSLEGVHLTRPEIGAALARERIEAQGPRLVGILMHAELEGVICSGRLRGNQRTYALLDERAPSGVVPDRSGAIARLAERYFATRGPATLKDFLWWSSLTTGEARAGMEAAALERVDVDGRAYWAAGRATPPRSPRSPRIDLVQVYDEVMMSYTESRDVLLATAPEAATWTGHPHAILLDGRLIGRWRVTRRSGGVEVHTRLHRSLSPAERASLELAGDRYARFEGAAAMLV